MIRRTAFLLPLLCASVAYADGASAPAKPGSVEHASAEDCAIIVEIGKAKMGWGEKAPEYDFFPIFDTKGGSYIQDCTWKDFGVADPIVGTPGSLRGFYITRPVYNGSQATADLNLMMRSPVGPNGARGAPFLEGDRCTLEKRDGHWRLVKCEMQYITRILCGIIIPHIEKS